MGWGSSWEAVIERRRLLPNSFLLVSSTMGGRFESWRWGLLFGVWETVRRIGGVWVWGCLTVF